MATSFYINTTHQHQHKLRNSKNNTARCARYFPQIPRTLETMSHHDSNFSVTPVTPDTVSHHDSNFSVTPVTPDTVSHHDSNLDDTPDTDTAGEFKKWGNMPLILAVFLFQWGISTTFRARKK